MRGQRRDLKRQEYDSDLGFRDGAVLECLEGRGVEIGLRDGVMDGSEEGPEERVGDLTEVALTRAGGRYEM